MELYFAGLQRVFRYVDDHLAEDLSLAVLARVSGYSQYHFHRMFHATTGQTPHEYVLKRRVNTAASRLLYERCSITRIALECGFSSAGNFVRYFRKTMHCAPSQYRKNKPRKRPADTEDGKRKSYQADSVLDAMLSLTVMPDKQVAGMMVKGLSETFQSKTVEAAFDKLFLWAAEIGLDTEGREVMGITLDTPEVVPLPECRYFACITINEDIKSQGEIMICTLPLKGEYIKFSLARTRPDFPDIFFRISDYLYGSYMPRIGCYPDNRSFVEKYRKKGTEIDIEFYVPVRWQDAK